MPRFKVTTTENQYQPEQYRVTVAHFETLSSISVGVGQMGSAAYGVLSKAQAGHVARGIRLNIDWTQYDELTDELKDEIRSITETRLQSWEEMTA